MLTQPCRINSPEQSASLVGEGWTALQQNLFAPAACGSRDDIALFRGGHR